MAPGSTESCSSVLPEHRPSGSRRNWLSLTEKKDTAWEERGDMATMQKEGLRPLTLAEQRELQAITKASSERVDRVKRATAVLAVAGGGTFSAAARATGYRSPQAVTYLVRRFNQVGLASLGI